MPSRVALVTGASRGIGRAIAERLAATGHGVAINHRDSAEAAKEAAQAIEGAGGEAIVVQADIAKATSIEAMFVEVEERLGPVSVLVNNAGIRRDALTLRLSDDNWHAVLTTNLYGPFACSRRALRTMVRQRWGRVVNVASVAGIRGIAGQANYCAAKAGLLGLTKAIAIEVAHKGVTVNAVAPGLVDTDLTRSLPEERYVELESLVPSKRAASPHDIAGAVAFLCTDEASYINGSVLPIDGAMTA